MRRLRVLMLCDKFDYHGSYINGPVRSTLSLVSRLQRFDVVLAVLRSRGLSDQVFRKEHIDVTYLGCSKFSPLAIIRIMKLIRNNAIDIVHLTGYGSTTLGRLAARLCGKSVIIHERWVDPHMNALQRALERWLARYTTKAIAISDYARTFLIAKKGIPKERIVLIRNGIPLEPFHNGDQEAGRLKRQKWGISADAPVVGIVGMLHENKGHRYFIEAAALLKPSRPSARFVVIGDGELRAELERLVTQLNVTEHVMFVGHQDDMPAVLQALDIWVMASASETAPVSLLEAMAAGRAVITTDCGGPSEIIRHGLTGLVVPVRHSRAIADSITYLLENPAARRVLGENARKDSKQYDIRVTVQAIEALYEEVAAGAGQLSASSQPNQPE